MLLLNLGLGDLNRDLFTKETVALRYRVDDPSSVSTVNMIRCYKETLDNRDCMMFFHHSTISTVRGFGGQIKMLTRSYFNFSLSFNTYIGMYVHCSHICPPDPFVKIVN